MDILYQSWLVFTWYLVLQNILLDLLCLFIFINFHSLLKGFLPLSSLSCGHPKIETNIWKGNCQGVCLSGPDFWFWGDLFRGFWGQQKIPRTLRYLISFWMQFTHSTLYLIYLIQTGPPWNTYHKKKKGRHNNWSSVLVRWSGSQNTHYLMPPPHMSYVVFS